MLETYTHNEWDNSSWEGCEGKSFPGNLLGSDLRFMALLNVYARKGGKRLKLTRRTFKNPFSYFVGANALCVMA